MITAPLSKVWMWAGLAGVYSLVALLKSRPPFVYIPDIPIGLDAALSLAMALIISFRVNRAYERWWEARTLWGTLVNASRNLAVKIRQLRQPPLTERRIVRDLIVGFCLALRDHLRGNAQLSKLPGFDNSGVEPAHVPLYVVGKIYDRFHQWRTGDQALGDLELLVLDSEARVLLNVCGGCEKIRNTPVSISWKVFTTQCIVTYLLVLPWGLFDDFGVWIVPLTVAVAYIIVAAEAIARYVEEPFGPDEDHLDLDAITEAISHSVSEAMLDDELS